MQKYIESLEALTGDVRDALIAKKAPVENFQFGGPGQIPEKTPRIPGEARSEFLANRAMGDWAEDLLAGALTESLTGQTISHYGAAGKIPAGSPGFKEHYLAGLEDTRVFGKRPDLLVFPTAANADRDLTDIPTKELVELVKRSLGAIEVRSSKTEALHYMKVKAERKKGKALTASDVPSFTVKIEDLRIVYRWIQIHQVPQVYVQVFFDSVFTINVLDIFRTIASGKGFRLVKPDKSQGKNTIMIPITSGVRIDTKTTVPDFSVDRRRTELGRHDAYVVPTGGSTTIDPDAFFSVLQSR